LNGWAWVEGKVQDRSEEGPVSVVVIVGRFKGKSIGVEVNFEYYWVVVR